MVRLCLQNIPLTASHDGHDEPLQIALCAPVTSTGAGHNSPQLTMACLPEEFDHAFGARHSGSFKRLGFVG